MGLTTYQVNTSCIIITLNPFQSEGYAQMLKRLLLCNNNHNYTIIIIITLVPPLSFVRVMSMVFPSTDQ